MDRRLGYESRAILMQVAEKGRLLATWREFGESKSPSTWTSSGEAIGDVASIVSYKQRERGREGGIVSEKWNRVFIWEGVVCRGSK